MEAKGRIIVIEGSGDGCGKSTQIALLKNALLMEGNKFFTHHFPSYGTYHGALIEHYLQGDFGTDSSLINPYFAQSLYAVDRAIACRTILKEPYENNYTILLDRYTTSSLIYQSASITDLEEKKAFLDFATSYEYQKLGIYLPDTVVFLHLPYDIMMQLKDRRSQNEGIEHDIYERDKSILRTIYENSVFVADYLDWDIIECSKNGSIRDKQDIHEDVYKLVKKQR